MKSSLLILSALFLFSCSAPAPRKPAAPDPAKIEKNKETALLNEVGEIVRALQSMEKLGRNMDAYRQAPDAESRRTCQVQLTAPLVNLNSCVSCSRKSNESCVKARASINKTIKEIYQ